MREDIARPIVNRHIDVDRKASREYVFGKKKENPTAKCCKCGMEYPTCRMAWVGDGVYKCKLCLMMGGR